VIDPEGYVYRNLGDSKLPIKNAKVTLMWLDPLLKQYQPWPADKYSQENPQFTDERGNYSFLVPEGSYYIQVEDPGYISYQSDAFRVSEGKGVRFNIELTPKYWWLKPINWELVFLVIISIILICNLLIKGRIASYFKINKLLSKRDEL